MDLRSYEKQGLDVISTVHMGPAASAMERRGIQTNLGNLNRDIRAANRMMAAVRKTIQNLRDWINEITEAIKELPEESHQKMASPNLVNLLQDYLNLRKVERADWSKYGQQKGMVKDLQMFANATNYLKDHEIFTLEKLDNVLAEVKQRYGGVTSGMRKSESRMKIITGIQRAVSTCQQHKAVHDKYVQTGWKKAQAAYAEKHRDELDAYNMAYRFLKKQGLGMDVNLAELQMEYEQLQASHAEYARQLTAVREELKPLEEIRHCVGREDVTWETCTLRPWLNDDFYNTAFNDAEKSFIVETQLETTKDKVFLLSRSEAISLFDGDDSRKTSNTEYANSKADPYYSKWCFWWLRSRSSDRSNDIADIVYGSGGTIDAGWMEPAARYVDEEDIL